MNAYEELEKDLRECRSLLWDRIPDAIRERLDAPFYVRRVDKSPHSWHADFVRAVTEYAEAHAVSYPDRLQVPFGFREVRAPCPLCGEVAVQWRAIPGAPEGFAVPHGLTVHLEGQGQVRQCRVARQFYAARRAAEREAEVRPPILWSPEPPPPVPVEPAAPGEALKERLLKVWPSKHQPFATKPFHEVIRSAEALTSGDRAPCPLCDARPEGDTVGFKMPLGLKAHLSQHCREFSKIEAEVAKRGRSRISGRLS